jgi:hypothetical protein
MRGALHDDVPEQKDHTRKGLMLLDGENQQKGGMQRTSTAMMVWPTQGGHAKDQYCYDGVSQHKGTCK